MSSEVVRFLAPIWVLLGGAIVGYGLCARRNATALSRGCYAVAVLWVLAGALVNATILVFGGSYSGFADGAYVDFVHDTWESLVVPHQTLFVGLLVAFEALAGGIVLVPGLPRRVGLIALIGFNVALVSFGWGFYLWSLPVGTGLVLLLREEQRRAAPVVAGSERRHLGQVPAAR
jgi:hypothetical protein